MEEMGLLVDADDYYRAFYRAASQARRYILLSGWQFDSDVALLRGGEEEGAPHPVTLLELLSSLCESNPELEIFVLAWDFHVVFALDREWLQDLLFLWTANPRLRFRFDSSHVERGCHHQKFVVIDGELSFLGGLDLCDHRWDDRNHRQDNPLRVSRGAPHKPFHDVQAYLRGREVARSLRELFMRRWERTGGDPMDLPEPEGATPFVFKDRPRNALVLSAKEVTLSRTDPYGSPDGLQNCTEIRSLYLDAITAAERLLYIETQYLSARSVAEALEQRMRAPGRPLLEIVLVLNMKAETFKEHVAVGLAQAQVLGRLRETAAETGHHLGVYYTVPYCEDGDEPERATYIHSKLLIVDDRFLSVGSANLTNRSLTIDTELNASIEAERRRDAPGGSDCIRSVRAALLGEHMGGPDIDLEEGLVAHLDETAQRAAAGGCPCRLRLHPSPTKDERATLAVIDPRKLPFDPDPLCDHAEEDRSLFVGGLGALWQHLFSNRDGAK